MKGVDRLIDDVDSNKLYIVMALKEESGKAELATVYIGVDRSKALNIAMGIGCYYSEVIAGKIYNEGKALYRMMKYTDCKN